MNIVFWNTNRNKNINKYILQLIDDRNIDIIVLAEYTSQENKLINDLYIKELNYESAQGISCKKIKIIFKKDINIILNDDNANYISLKIERTNLRFQLFASHFPSKLRTNERDRRIIAQEMKGDIDKYENAIIVGDFNSNPFEETVIALSGLNALPTQEMRSRIVQRRKEKILYNPMWRFFGDFTSIPGTYFYNNSSDINYYWNIFDQVLITHNFIKYFEDEKLEIVKSIGSSKLIKKQKPNKEISDHLPIFISIKEEK